MLAPWAPLTKPYDTSAGKPSTSTSIPPATASTAAAAGEVVTENPFWSQVETSHSAASEAGVALPITKPK